MQGYFLREEAPSFSLIGYCRATIQNVLTTLVQVVIIPITAGGRGGMKRGSVAVTGDMCTPLLRGTDRRPPEGVDTRDLHPSFFPCSQLASCRHFEYKCHQL